MSRTYRTLIVLVVGGMAGTGEGWLLVRIRPAPPHSSYNWRIPAVQKCPQVAESFD